MTEKTELIHLTRSKKQHRVRQIIMNKKIIKLSDTAKLLDVIFDKEMWWKKHVQQAVKQATQINIALNELWHLHSEQMRQLYQVCAALVVDYASTVWHNLLKDKTHLRLLWTVQWKALICILFAFKTASTTALKIESHMLSTHLQLKQCVQILAVSLSTLLNDHSAHTAAERAKICSRHIGLDH